MEKKKKTKIQEHVNVKLAGMGLYGTTSNEEVAGYKTSGDVENAGKPEKGFQRPDEEVGAQASVQNK